MLVRPDHVHGRAAGKNSGTGTRHGLSVRGLRANSGRLKMAPAGAKPGDGASVPTKIESHNVLNP